MTDWRARAKYHRTEGICLRRIDYSNTSQVATFLTADSGRLSFLAKGVKRAPKRGVRTGFDLLASYELIYTERRAGSLLNLTKRSMIESFRGLREALERTLCAYYAAELVLNLTAEGLPCPRLHELLLESLRRFARGENLGLTVLTLEIGALQELGSCPTFEACAECDNKLGRTGRLLFSPSHGGALCASCGHRLYQGATAQALPAQASVLDVLAGLAATPPARPEHLRINPNQIVAASRLLRHHIRYLIDKELRMWKYLQDRHLSKALQRIRQTQRK